MNMTDKSGSLCIGFYLTIHLYEGFKSSPTADSTAATPTTHTVGSSPTITVHGFKETSTDERKAAKMSFISYVRAELTAGYLLEEKEERMNSLKEARMHTFMNIPKEFERLILFGLFVCLDSFLFIFTFLPIRVLLAALSLPIKRFSLSHTQVCDVLRAAIFLSCSVALQYVDSSRLYHSIRGQSVMKLYVIFNMLEIFDKLCCAFGQDILDTLFHNAVRVHTQPRDSRKTVRRSMRLGLVTHIIIATIYVFIHSLVIFNQLMTLNVAINSHNSALLTLVVSTQFVELKGSVFKRFEVNNLFQLSCADMVERFNIVMFLLLISLRNLTELAWDINYFFTHLFIDVLLVYFSEMVCVLSAFATVSFLIWCPVQIVDWIKHAFIAKFNHIQSDIYGKYITILSKDLASSSVGCQSTGRKINRNIGGEDDSVLSKDAALPSFMDQSHFVSRRIGFVSLPLASIVVRIFSQSIPAPPRSIEGVLVVLLAYLIICTLKLIVGIVLLGRAYNRWHCQGHLCCSPPGVMTPDAGINESAAATKAATKAATIDGEGFTNVSSVMKLGVDDPQEIISTDTSDITDNISRYDMVRSKIP